MQEHDRRPLANLLRRELRAISGLNDELSR
jgi:hypothetical protein